MSIWDTLDFSTLLGKTITAIDTDKSEYIIFRCSDGTAYKLEHCQDCCENVTIDDICGDLDDLIGTPILLAELVTNEGENPDGVTAPKYQDSWTWSFYKLVTMRGGVTIRWYGESNGYYSEEVNFYQLEERND